MNLREIAGNHFPPKVLQAKLQQQRRQIEQLEEENRWLKEQLKKAIEQADNKHRTHPKRR